MKINSEHKYSQRAVAPIIATLLMVAISVVGGILIFVFAQGFFTDTSIQTPTIESLEIFGYDARDTAGATPGHKMHNDDPSVTTDDVSVGGARDGNLQDNDPITIYARNKGAGPVTIDKIKIYGADYTWDSAKLGAAIGAATAATATERFFGISSDGAVASATFTDSPVIQPGQEVSIIISYDQDTNGLVKIGRPIPVVIITGGGATFTKQVQNGVQVG